MTQVFDENATMRITQAVGSWDQGASCLAALTVVTDAEATEPLLAAAREVMTAVGLVEELASDRLPFSPDQLRGIAASPLLQGAGLVNGSPPGWAGRDPATLAAQGQASGATVALFGRMVLPLAPDLGDRLSRPGARMLDVGTGIGALAVGFAEAFPQLQVTGIDVLPQVLDLAQTSVRGSSAASRVELRRQDIADLSDEATYDLAWVPAPFIPRDALWAGVPRVLSALRPGGLVMIGHGSLEGSDLQIALTRFKTALYGGTALDATEAASLLRDNGFTTVQTLSTLPGAPSITLGRR